MHLLSKLGTFDVSNISRPSSLSRRDTTAHSISRFQDVFNKHTIYLRNNFYFLNPTSRGRGVKKSSRKVAGSRPNEVNEFF
jgi:hypothetical protein